MHIAIEGMDGSGKTSTAKKIAEIIGFEFIEKPLHYLTDSEDRLDNYLEITERVNQMDPKIKARFYGVGNYLVSCMAKTGNVITDRHLVSNYYWNGENDDYYFDVLVSNCGLPDLTFVLYVTGDERKRRIAERNPVDPDLDRNVFNDTCYQRMRVFLKRYNMNHYFIDSTRKSFDGVLDEIISIIQAEIALTNTDKEKSSIQISAKEHNTVDEVL